jgi:hypothetical protein
LNHNRLVVFGILTAVLLFTSACGVVNTLLGANTSAGTVSELWPDVPRLDGLEKANLEMPLAARLAIQAVTQGRINFIAFTTTRPPQEVQDFYTQERMQQSGWNTTDATGCLGADGAEASVGAICMFRKEVEGRNEVLAIIVAREEGSAETQVFFARVDASQQQESQ